MTLTPIQLYFFFNVHILKKIILEIIAWFSQWQKNLCFNFFLAKFRLHTELESSSLALDIISALFTLNFSSCTFKHRNPNSTVFLNTKTNREKSGDFSTLWIYSFLNFQCSNLTGITASLGYFFNWTVYSEILLLTF